MTSSSPVKNNPNRTFLKTGKVLMPTDAASPVSCGNRRLPAGRISPPLRTSLPTRRIHSPNLGFLLITTNSFSTAQCSCITIASAPGGIGAPVKMRAAVPGSSGLPTEPARIFCFTVSRAPSAMRTA